MNWILENRWSVGVAIVVVGLLIGFRDVIRFSLVRIWAISSVVWQESKRKKVLLITPLAIVGVIVVSQFQNPLDAQDAIRQTTKFCLFATGLLVAITAIILAATNLPKEIENRVIYTVVTKPTTRLEIVLGKVLGFARVSAAILVIMGLFTWGYLKLRENRMTSNINAQLATGNVDPISKQTLQHYVSAGLLQSRSYEPAEELEIYSRLPTEKDPREWMFGNSEQDCVVPFDLTARQLIAVGDPTQTPGSQGLVIVAQIGYEQGTPTAQEWETIDAARRAEEMAKAATQPAATQPATQPAMAPTTAAAATQPAAPDTPDAGDRKLPSAMVQFTFLDQNLNGIGTPQDINGGQQITLPPPYMGMPVQVPVAPALAAQLANHQRVYLLISVPTPSTEYTVDEKGVSIIVPGMQPGVFAEIKPAGSPIFRGRSGTYGQQLRGGSKGPIPVAVYRFRNAEMGEDEKGDVPMYLRAGIERSGAETTEEDVPTQLDVRIRNLATNQTSQPVGLTPESNRPAYFSVPKAATEGGNFDVLIRNKTDGHWIGLYPGTLSLVTGSQPFAFNLAKSLFILWLMAVLIIAIALFCSTFLSWPIAIVLTLVILLGRWGVMQLGDATAPGIGNQVATDLGFQDAAKAKVVSTTVEALSKSLNYMAMVLPDINKYPATEHIQRGTTIPAKDIYGAMGMTFGFGIPLMILAYVFLKFKEVAP